MKLAAPKQLPKKFEPDFDSKAVEFYRAVYQMWDALQSGNIRIVEKTPASATADGEVGHVAFDANYVYFVIAKDTWRRIAHATW